MVDVSEEHKDQQEVGGEPDLHEQPRGHVKREHYREPGASEGSVKQA
jgi:hypothetical protein